MKTRQNRQSNEQICASCAYTQGRQSWCDDRILDRLKKTNADEFTDAEAKAFLKELTDSLR